MPLIWRRRDKKELVGCTFQPKIDPKSELLAANKHFSASAGIHHMDSNLVSTEIFKLQEATFQPTISAKSEKLAKAKHFDATAKTHHQFSEEGKQDKI